MNQTETNIHIRTNKMLIASLMRICGLDSLIDHHERRYSLFFSKFHSGIFSVNIFCINMQTEKNVPIFIIDKNIMTRWTFLFSLTIGKMEFFWFVPVFVTLLLFLPNMCPIFIKRIWFCCVILTYKSVKRPIEHITMNGIDIQCSMTLFVET